MLTRNFIGAIALAASLAVNAGAAETGRPVSGAADTKTVPAFELMTSDSVLFKWPSKDYPKPLLLWFTNLCGGCQSALPELDSLYLHDLPPGVELAAVSLLGKDRSTVNSIKLKFGVKFPILIDPDGRLCRTISGSYIAEVCPMNNFFLVGTQGQILFAGHVPGASRQEITAAIKSAATRP